MKQLLDNYREIHCIGIGGTGLSALARMLKNSGANVTGSDEKDTPIIQQLRNEGISVSIGHTAKTLPKTAEVVIYSPAIPDNNPERTEARKLKLKELSYPEAVGELTQKKTTISICGTHGKTTTTAMTAAAFIACDMDPDVIVGASVKELNGKNERIGKGEYLILESCEYKRNFLHYHPKIIIITNIEIDHLDYYKDLTDYISAFEEFLMNMPQNGLIIANIDDTNTQKLINKIVNRTQTQIVTYGRSEKADYNLNGTSIFKKNQKIANIQLKIPGAHNLMNATAVIALCSELHINLQNASNAINQYTGSSRRFEYKGIIQNTIIIDDYAHHPTEIEATLKAVRDKFGQKAKVLCIFQPHQYSRTYKLLEGFIRAFKDADEVIIPNILRVRDSEQDVNSMNEEKLVLEMKKHHPKVSFGINLEKTANSVKKRLKEFNVIITMGAGDVWKIAENLLEKKY